MPTQRRKAQTTTRPRRLTRATSAERKNEIKNRLEELKSKLFPEGNGGGNNIEKLKFDMNDFLRQNPKPGLTVTIDDNLANGVYGFIFEIPVVLEGSETDKKKFLVSMMKFAMHYLFLDGPHLVITTHDESVDDWVGLLQQCGNDTPVFKDTDSISLENLYTRAGFLILSKGSLKIIVSRRFKEMTFHVAIVEEAGNEDFLNEIRPRINRVVIMNTNKLSIDGALIVRLEKAFSMRFLLVLIGVLFFVMGVLWMFYGLSGPEM